MSDLPDEILNHPVWTTPLQGFQLIQASAGTGKTWTLSSIVIRSLLESSPGHDSPLRIEQIALITFTRAATAELTQRVQARVNQVYSAFLGEPTVDPFVSSLLERYEAHLPNSLLRKKAVQRLRLAQLSMDRLQVGTIHSFAARLMRQGIGDPSGLEAVEVLESDIGLFHQLLDEFWSDLLQPNAIALRENEPKTGPEFFNLSARQKMILSRWLAESPSALSTRNQDSLEDLQAGLPPNQDLLQVALIHPWAPTRSLQKSLETLIDNLDQAWQSLRQLPLADWADWAERTHQAPGLDRRSFKNPVKIKCAAGADLDLRSAEPPMPSKEQIGLMDRLLWRIPAMKLRPEDRPAHALPIALEAFRAALDDFENLPSAIAHCFRTFALPRAEEIKAQNASCTRDDLILRLHDGLQDPAHRYRLRKQYPLLLLDEAQDTDGPTWRALLPVYKDRSDAGLLAVGDPKQAIYRFRGADVREFLAARDQAQGQFDLTSNQRSNSDLVEFINTLFHASDSFATPDIRLAPNVAARRVVPQVSGFPAIRIDHLQDGSTKKAIDALAHEWVVGLIHQLKAAHWSFEKRVDPTDLRFESKPVKWNDFAVLVSKNEQAQTIRRVLNNAGIPAVETGNDSVAKTDEAEELLTLLNFIAQPNNQASRQRALATRIVGGFASMEILRTQESERAIQQIADLEEMIGQVQRAWQRFGPYSAILQFLEAMDCQRRLLTLVSGQRRWLNLLHLLELLSQATPKLAHPAQAIHWVERLIAGDEGLVDPEMLELRLESDAQFVRVMTVHKSKGLQFRICLLPYINEPSSNSSRAVEAFLDRPTPTSDQSALIELVVDQDVPESVARRKWLEEESERRRKLYVALTRAQDHCFLLVSQDKAKSDEEQSTWTKLYQALPRDDLSQKPSFDLAFGNRNVRVNLVEQVYQSPVQEVSSLVEPNVNGGASPPIFEFRPWEIPVDAVTKSKRYRIEPAWSRASFSSLASSIELQRQANAQIVVSNDDLVERVVDHDRRSAQVVEFEMVQPQDQSLQLQGVRSTLAAGEISGRLVHRIFELSDFSKGIETVIVERALRDYKLDPALCQPLQNWLNEVLQTPIPLVEREIALTTIPVADCYLETEFSLAVSFQQGASSPVFADLKALRAGLSRWGFSVERIEELLNLLSWRLKRGLLSGVIDLCFRSDDELWVLDWKTNYLGAGESDYRDERLTVVMQEALYDLQALIYAVATYRAIKASSEPTGLKFGGVIYAFVRAIGHFANSHSRGWWVKAPDDETMFLLDRGFGQWH